MIIKDIHEAKRTLLDAYDSIEALEIFLDNEKQKLGKVADALYLIDSELPPGA